MRLTILEQERSAYIRGTPFSQEVFDGWLTYDAVASLKLETYEVAVGFPAEDCLQGAIDAANRLAKGRVTKADVKALAEQLEELQNSLSQAAEHGADEFKKLIDRFAEITAK